MSVPTTGIMTGTFVSAGTALNVAIPFGPQEVELYDVSDVGSAASTTPIMLAKWSSLMPNGSAVYVPKTNGAATLGTWTSTSTNGISAISWPLTVGAPTAITAITNANPAIASSATLPAIGNIVRIYGTTGMLQIAGMDFSVTALGSGTFTLGYLNASGFSTAASAGNYVLLSSDYMFYPRNRYITNITQASSAVITMSVTHGFTVGQDVRINVPSAFGMTQISGQIGTITAINTTNNTITVNINSTGYTAFAFPTSATAAGGVTFPQVIPVGEAATSPYQNLLDDATHNTAYYGLTFGTAVQTSGSTYQWVARRGTQ